MVSKRSCSAFGSDRLSYASGTDIGLKRSVNEDHWIAADIRGTEPRTVDPAMVFAVADGLGGHSGGHVASKLACDGVLSRYQENSFLENLGQSSGLSRKRLSSLLEEIDEEIRSNSLSDEALEDMGTTLSILTILKETAVVAHVGDSRIYRFRDRRLEQLTPDHSFVQEMIEEGELSQKDAETHPLRHMLTSVLGTEEPLETFFIDTFPVRPGDKFLLCSDGLTNMVSDNTIARLMGTESEPEEIVARLIEKALANGGKDNVTVIIVCLSLFSERSEKRKRDLVSGTERKHEKCKT